TDLSGRIAIDGGDHLRERLLSEIEHAGTPGDDLTRVSLANHDTMGGMRIDQLLPRLQLHIRWRTSATLVGRVDTALHNGDRGPPVGTQHIERGAGCRHLQPTGDHQERPRILVTYTHVQLTLMQLHLAIVITHDHRDTRPAAQL